MDDFKNKNDYSVTVYHNNEKRLFTEYVNGIYAYTEWLKKQSIQWHYILVYVRRSRVVLCYYEYGDHIDNKPNFFNRGRTKKEW